MSSFANFLYRLMLRHLCLRILSMAPPVAKDFQALSCLLQLHLRQAVTKLDGLLFTPFFWGLR